MNTTKTILLCAAAAAMAGCSEPDTTEPAPDAQRPSSVTEADLDASPLARLAKAIEDGDAAMVARHVNYPLKRQEPLPPIRDEKEFVERFPILFDDAFRARMRNGSFTNDWAEVGWRGTMFDNGMLWVDGTFETCGDICGVHYQSAAEKQWRNSLVEEERKTLHPSLAELCNPVCYFVTEDGKTVGRVDSLDEENQMIFHVRIALFDTPIRPGAKPVAIFRAWDNDGIWLSEDWRLALQRPGVGNDLSGKYRLLEKKVWDDPQFSTSRFADGVLWKDVCTIPPAEGSREPAECAPPDTP